FIVHQFRNARPQCLGGNPKREHPFRGLDHHLGMPTYSSAHGSQFFPRFRVGNIRAPIIEICNGSGGFAFIPRAWRMDQRYGKRQRNGGEICNLGFHLGFAFPSEVMERERLPAPMGDQRLVYSKAPASSKYTSAASSSHSSKPQSSKISWASS